MSGERHEGPPSHEEADEDDDSNTNGLGDGLAAVRIELHRQQDGHHNLRDDHLDASLDEQRLHSSSGKGNEMLPCSTIEHADSSALRPLRTRLYAMKHWRAKPLGVCSAVLAMLRVAREGSLARQAHEACVISYFAAKGVHSEDGDDGRGHKHGSCDD